MIFLEDTDLKSQMFQVFITENTADTVDVIDKIEATNIALIKSKLNQRFDVDAIFSAVGEARDLLIVNHLTALVLCGIVGRNSARKMPSDVKESCKEAKQWLNDVRDFKENPDLPLIDTEDPISVKYGSNSKDEFYY